MGDHNGVFFVYRTCYMTNFIFERKGTAHRWPGLKIDEKGKLRIVCHFVLISAV